jgi:hypothetical protein
LKDEIAVFGKAGDQFCAGVGKIAAFVMLEMPVIGDDSFQKRVKRPILGDQALVQSSWAPVI